MQEQRQGAEKPLQSTTWAPALSHCQRPPPQTRGGAGFFETESSNLWLPKEPPAWGLRRQARETQEDLLPEARTGWRVKQHTLCPEVHMLLYSQPFLSPVGSLPAQ